MTPILKTGRISGALPKHLGKKALRLHSSLTRMKSCYFTQSGTGTTMAMADSILANITILKVTHMNFGRVLSATRFSMISMKPSGLMAPSISGP